MYRYILLWLIFICKIYYQLMKNIDEIIFHRDLWTGTRTPRYNIQNIHNKTFQSDFSVQCKFSLELSVVKSCPSHLLMAKRQW